VAEDNSVNQEVAQQMLQKRGYSVTIASNGREAVTLVSESPAFDLILMDIQMPEMDGFQATAAIRELEKSRGRRTPIVAMTAHAMKGDRERCLDSGMDGYISKPVQSKILYETIDKITGATAVALQGSESAALSRTSSTIIDLDEVLERIDGNIGLLQSVVSLFEEDYPKQLARIRHAVEAGDAASLNAAAHTLKGSLLALAADRAAAVALELEKMGRESRFDGAVQTSALLDSEVLAVSDELQKILRDRLTVAAR
jgi:CheY-like chemotaxis protein/HPt (histidine-containing phosphotransfer) domain-containing protein